MRSLLLLFLLAQTSLPAQTYGINTIAGYINDWGDGAPPSQASFSAITALAADPKGNVYVAEEGRIHRLGTDGTTRTVAGNGEVTGLSSDGGPAIFSRVNAVALAVDASGVIYFIDPSSYVRKVELDGTLASLRTPSGPLYAQCMALHSSGVLFTATYGKISSYPPSGGLSTFAEPPYYVSAMAFDRSGNLLAVLPDINQIWKFDAQGNPTVFAGAGASLADGVPAVQAMLQNPKRIATDPQGNLYIASDNFQGIRKVDPNGIITTLNSTFYGYRLATSPAGEVYAMAGNLYGPTIVRISPDGAVHPFAGGGIGDGGPAIRAYLDGPTTLAADRDGNIYIAESNYSRVRKIDAAGVITTVASRCDPGLLSGPAPALGACLSRPSGIAVDGAGNLYISDSAANLIRKVDRAGVISTIAGTGGAANALNAPTGIRVDPAGNFFFIDYGSHRIRKISTSGILSTVAGDGEDGGYCSSNGYGDGGPAILGRIGQVSSIALDAAGNLYILEQYGGCIRKVSPNGVISTVASGLDFPKGLTIDAAGNLFVGDYLSVWKIAPDGTKTRIAGTGSRGNTAFGAPALEADLGPISDLISDGKGALLLSDQLSTGPFNSFVRKLEPANIFPARILNAASRQNDFLSPGKIISIQWAGMGPEAPVSATPARNGQFTTTLAGTRVLFNGLPAPVLYADSLMVNAIVPFSLPEVGATLLQVEYQGKLSNTLALPTAPASPGIFDQVILNQDLTVNSFKNPAAQGSVIVMFATGAGLLKPSLPDGSIASDASSVPVHPPTVQIGSQNAEILYAGVAPGLVAGVLQLNVRVPFIGAKPPAYPVKLIIAGAESQSGVFVYVL